MSERAEAIREWVEAARRVHSEGHLEQNSCCTMVDEEVPWLLDRVERLEALVSGVKADLKGGRRSAWQQKRGALERIREWEGREG